jgi:hypothetical protein
LIQIQNSISVVFGKPHLYKNFWFGQANDPRSPTILFGCIPADSDGTALKRVMSLCEVLLKYCIVSPLAAPDVIGEIYYQVMW